MEKENNALFIIFGGSGDLAKRKLYPALFRLFLSGSLKTNFAVIGTSRRNWPDEYYQNIVFTAIKDVGTASDEMRHDFSRHFFYQANDVTDLSHFQILKQRAQKITQEWQIVGPWIYYLAMSPNFFGTIASNLARSNFLDPAHPNRLVIEKPFGHDLASAKELNQAIQKAFTEADIYRIDHYLGKEMVQNILPWRFSNPLIRAIWNRDFISNFQITLAEQVGVEERAGYYEQAGALRDMFQNHIAQLISLLIMAEPKSLQTADLVQSKAFALQNITELTQADLAHNFVRGQYAAAAGLNGYRQEDGVAVNSQIETYVAGKLTSASGPLLNVPVYFRTGKRLKQKMTRIDVVFKTTAAGIYPTKNTQMPPNVLTILIDPRGGFKFSYQTKAIGDRQDLQGSALKREFSITERQQMPEAYQRLFHDVLNGDKTNFVQWHQLCASWKITDQVNNYWQDRQPTPDFFYPAGSMGPKAADELLAKDGHFWIYRG